MQTIIGVNECLELIKVKVTYRPLSSSINTKIFISERTWPIQLKFNVEPPWIGALKFFFFFFFFFFLRYLRTMTKMAATPIYGKNPSKIFFSRTDGPIAMKLGM